MPYHFYEVVLIFGVRIVGVVIYIRAIRPIRVIRVPALCDIFTSMKLWQKILLSIFGVFTFAALALPYLIPLPPQANLDPQALAPADGRFITANGIRTFIQEFGPAEGEPVVLVHGFGASTFTWRDNAPALAEAGYRVLALDLVGYGLSDKSFALDFSHPAQADFVAAVMETVGIKRATLVGHSMGGSVIGHLAQRHPERVAALVFVDGAVREATANSGGGSILGIPVQLGSLAEFPPFQRWGRIALLYGLTRERMAATQLTAYYRKEIVTPAVEEGYLQVQKIKDWDLALLGVLRDSGRNALSQPLSTLTAPTLIIWGEQDSWVPLARGQALHAALPQSEFVIIPNTGHLPMEEDVAAFNAALLGWLGKLKTD